MEKYTCGLSDDEWADKGSQQAVLTPHVAFTVGAGETGFVPCPLYNAG